MVNFQGVPATLPRESTVAREREGRATTATAPAFASVYPRVMLVRISLFSSSLAACQGPKTGLLNFYYVEQENRGGVRNYQGRRQLESKSASKNVNVARERTSIVRLTRLDLSRNKLPPLFVFLETNSLKFEFTYVYVRGRGRERG